jgi:nicotinamidase-related amidase
VSRTALVVIDMINAYDFPDADKVIPSAESAVPVVEEFYEDLAEAALRMMERNMDADLSPVRG